MDKPQEMVVDVVAKVNNQDVTYQKLPANLDIADFGTNGIVVADNKLAMNFRDYEFKTEKCRCT